VLNIVQICVFIFFHELNIGTLKFSDRPQRQQHTNNVIILQLIMSTLIKWFLNKHLRKKVLYNNFVNERISCFSGHRKDHLFFLLILTFRIIRFTSLDYLNRKSFHQSRFL